MIVITLADVVGSWSWRGLYIKCQVVNYAMLATIMSFVVYVLNKLSVWYRPI